MTGGASAAYGADALAGVTNFMLNRDFRGVSLSLDAGATDFGDGDTAGFSLAGGFEISDRWSFIGSFESQTIDQIQRNPDESRRLVSGAGAGCRTPLGAPRIPPRVPRNLKLPDVHSTVHTPTGKIAGGFNGGPPHRRGVRSR